MRIETLALVISWLIGGACGIALSRVMMMWGWV